MGISTLRFGVPTVLIKYSMQEDEYTVLGPTTGGVDLTREKRKTQPEAWLFTVKSLVRHPKAMLGQVFDLKLVNAPDHYGHQEVEEIKYMELEEIITRQPANEMETITYVFREKLVIVNPDHSADFKIKP